MKKLLSMVLVLALMFSLLPTSLFGITASAETTDTEIISGTTGDCMWTLDGTKLTIFGNGAMDDYYHYYYFDSDDIIKSPWCDYASTIESVVVADGVTKVGREAFCKFTNLTSVTLGKDVSVVGDYAFGNCDLLKSVDLPDNVTEIGRAFYECGIVEITVPGTVKTIDSWAFSECNNLKRVILCDGVETMGQNAFEYCYALETVYLSNTLQNIPYRAFYYCYGLSKINIPDSVESIGSSAFYNTAISSITIPENVTQIETTVFEYSDIQKISIGSSLTSIGKWAFDCAYLTDVWYSGSDNSGIEVGEYNECVLSATWHYNACEPSEHVYENDCDALCDVCGFERNVIHKYDSVCDDTCNECLEPNENAHMYDNSHDGPDTICYLCGYERILTGASGSSTWILEKNVLTISGEGAAYFDIDGWPSIQWLKTKIEKVIINEGITGLSYGIFDGCENLVEVSLPSTLTDIDSYAFFGCTSLKHIAIPDFVDYIGYEAFSGCTALETVVLPDSVTYINSETFANCSSLKSVVMNRVHYIYESAFLGCTSLTDVWFGGVKEDIIICEGNEALEAASWHYEICTQNPDLGGHVFEEYKCIYCQKKEFLIVGIELDNDEVSIIENTQGSYYDFYGYYIYDIYNLEYTAILKDGTRVKSEWGYVTVNGDEFYLSDNSFELQWQGQWTKNNTYTITCSIDYSSDYNNFANYHSITANAKVTITESPIASIEIADVEIMEESDGYLVNGNFFYSVYASAIVTLKDGTVKELSRYESIEINGLYYSVNTNAYTLQEQQPWVVGGTYQVTGTLLGVSDTFNVTITKPPIASIEIADVTIIEGSGSQSENGGFTYYVYPSAIVTLKDGTVKEVYSGIEINGAYYSIYTNAGTLQDQEPWVAGSTYQVTGTLLGVSDTFNVTIVENPIKSFVVKDVVLYEGIDSYGGNYYYPATVLLEVLLKDGTTAEITDDGAIIYNGSRYYVNNNAWDLQYYEERWTVGTYEVTATLLGVSSTFNVTILENPIEELQLIKKPIKTEYLQGERVNLKGAVIRVQYVDGSFEDIVINTDYTGAYSRLFYSTKIDRLGHINLDDYDFDATGRQTAELELFGKTCEIPVVVKENLMAGIAISENADKSITITVTNSDKITYQMKLLDVVIFSWIDDGVYETEIFTDKGGFYATIYADENSFAIEMYNHSSGESVKSNVIAASDWFKSVRCADNYSLNMATAYSNNDVLNIEHFNGQITAENIDDIASLAAVHLSWPDDYDYQVSPDGVEYLVLEGDYVREVLKEFFGVDIDLSLSKNYDSKTDKYKTSKILMVDGAYERNTPIKANYNNGIWEIEITRYDNYGKECTLYLKLNNNQQIIGFDINSQVSDIVDGWLMTNGKWQYYKDGVAVVSNWVLDGGKWYWIESDGYMASDCWRKDSVGWVYLGTDGAMLTNSWCQDSQGWCYVGADGYAVTNCWKRDSVGWIWLNANGSMTKNTWVLDGGKWYYLDENGYMVCNQWKKDSVGWVYVGADGAMLTNSWCQDSQGWCYVGADGYAVTNCWKRDSVGWIWLNANGSMTKNNWVLDGGSWYYLDGNGYMLANTSCYIGGKTYYFNLSGVCTNP